MNLNQLTLIRSKRRRNLRLHVRADASVQLNAPVWISQKQLNSFIDSHQNWIKQRQDSTYLTHTLRHLSRIGSKRIEHVDSRAPGLLIEEQRAVIAMDRRRHGQWWDHYLLLRPQLADWFKREAALLLNGQINELRRAHNLQPKTVSYRFMRSRWGSCSKDGTIRLNAQLITLPKNHQQYVIGHELAHLMHPDHGTSFHKLLEDIIPRHRDISRQLKRHQLLY